MKGKPGKVPKERERYFIRLNTGEVCEVSREVYLCYYAGERQERYQKERDRKYGVISIEEIVGRLFEDGKGCAYDLIPSGEESIAEQVMKKMLIEQLYIALDQLQPEEKHLITALYFDNVGVRTYARNAGVTHHAIQKRRDKILLRLRELMK